MSEPTVMELCLVSSPFEPNDEFSEHEACSVRSETQRKLHPSNTENPDWFLAQEKANDIPWCINPEDDKVLSDLPAWAVPVCEMRGSAEKMEEASQGAEVFMRTPGSTLTENEFTKSTTMESNTLNTLSDTESVSSDGDLNSLGSVLSKGESTLYELFPSNSFASLAGFRCQVFTKPYGRCSSSESFPTELKTNESLARGRSPVRSMRSTSHRRRSGETALSQKFTVDCNGQKIGFNDNTNSNLVNQDGGGEDSIIECKAD